MQDPQAPQETTVRAELQRPPHTHTTTMEVKEMAAATMAAAVSYSGKRSLVVSAAMMLIDEGGVGFPDGGMGDEDEENPTKRTRHVCSDVLSLLQCHVCCKFCT